mgnify:CR=1 FL=1
MSFSNRAASRRSARTRRHLLRGDAQKRARRRRRLRPASRGLSVERACQQRPTALDLRPGAVAASCCTAIAIRKPWVCSRRRDCSCRAFPAARSSISRRRLLRHGRIVRLRDWSTTTVSRADRRAAGSCRPRARWRTDERPRRSRNPHAGSRSSTLPASRQSTPRHCSGLSSAPARTHLEIGYTPPLDENSDAPRPSCWACSA